jgi:hypothetical protein
MLDWRNLNSSTIGPSIAILDFDVVIYFSISKYYTYTKFEHSRLHIFRHYHAHVVLTKCVAAILDFDVVTYFSIVTYYTSRVTHTPNLNLLGRIFFELSQMCHSDADTARENQQDHIMPLGPFVAGGA